MQDILIAIWQQDFDQLMQLNKTTLLISCLALILFLESAFVFLPLPGDSLVLLSGGLIASGVFGYEVTLLYLPLAAGLGSLLAYWQGHALAHTRFMRSIERMVPPKSLHRATDLLERHGMLAMFISRFIPFVRVLTPMMMGMTRLHLMQVFIISFVSAFCWSMTLSLFSYMLLQVPQLAKYQQLMGQSLMVISAILFVLAVLAIIVRLIRRPPVAEPAVSQMPDDGMPR